MRKHPQENDRIKLPAAVDKVLPVEASLCTFRAHHRAWIWSGRNGPGSLWNRPLRANGICRPRGLLLVWFATGKMALSPLRQAVLDSCPIPHTHSSCKELCALWTGSWAMPLASTLLQYEPYRDCRLLSSISMPRTVRRCRILSTLSLVWRRVTPDQRCGWPPRRQA